jgi:sarcosine oxidase, subunit gamma
VTAETLRRSPLAGWATRLEELAPAVSVVEQPFLTHLTLRLRDAGTAPAVGAALGVDLPVAPCTFTSGTGPSGPLDVAWLGPEEYLVLTAPMVRADVETALRHAVAESPGAVVDVSAQRTTVTLTGPAVRDVLAHGCSIDLHPKAAPPGTCAQTLLARTGIVLLVRNDHEFTLLVRQSFAAYFAAWLVDATVEYRTGPA